MESHSKTPNRSRELFEEAQKYLPGGVSRNTIFRKPNPVYAEFGKGCYVTDIEGVCRLDVANNMASLIHGHACPEIVKAVQQQLQQGTAFTMATIAELEFAKLLCDRVPHFEKLRFVNSGTEAVMACIKAARCFTGRSKIAKVEGTYHGTYDYAEVSQKPKPENWGDAQRPASVPVAKGTPQGALDDVIIIPFNNPSLAREILDSEADELACILLDPMPHRVGLIPASNEFVAMLREWCDQNAALLILDEVITFRSGYAGAGEWFDAKPDLTAMGKIIGGGFPVGAFAGRNDVMDLLDPQHAEIPFPHSGTFSANPITMTAGKAAMSLFDRSSVEKINDLGEYARTSITESIREIGLPACVTGAGSMFRVHMKPEPPMDYRTAYMSSTQQQQITWLVNHLFESGFMMINTCTAALSTVMNRDHIDQLTAKLSDGFRQLRAPA